MQKQAFQSHGGEPVQVFTLENRSGMRVRLMDFGATLMEIEAPDKNGVLDHVVLAYDTPQGFIGGNCYFGATVGRYANRIARGSFAIRDTRYQLNCNEKRNHLHGGNQGFNRRFWSSRQMEGESVRFAYESRDGEEGYPGNVNAFVQFTLDDDNGLTLHYTAETDKPTPVNLTNHAYFNLAGHDAGDIGGHWLKINADAYTPIDSEFIPTGETAPVAGTPMDFTSPHRIGERVDKDFTQLKRAGGYDHNFVVNGSGMRVAAQALDPNSGRLMTVLTDKPCVQLYTGNMMGDIHGLHGAVYGRRGAFCLETQFAPDSPNQPQFPSVILQPGRKYAYTTCYRFGIADRLE